MDPDSDQLVALKQVAENDHCAEHQFAIASDYEPPGGSTMPLRALDALVDSWFGGDNDLVVPTGGVADLPGLQPAGSCKLPASSSVGHTGFFANEQVRAKMSSWLPRDGS